MLVAPATYNDLLSTLMLSRGVRPGGEQRRQRSQPAGPQRSVRAFDGKQEIPVTPEYERAADLYRRAALPKHMVKRTGSSPEAVAWLLSHRVEEG